jgi:hypothetical protein
MSTVYVRRIDDAVREVFWADQQDMGLEEMDEASPEVQALLYPELAASSENVDAERDRRISSGFTFGAIRYQSGPEDRENIMGASTAALAAIMGGAAAGDFRWADPEADFLWIDEANDSHLMDAQTMFAFGKTALAHKQAHIFAGRAIKDMSPIPIDYQDDKYWP